MYLGRWEPNSDQFYWTPSASLSSIVQLTTASILRNDVQWCTCFSACVQLNGVLREEGWIENKQFHSVSWRSAFFRSEFYKRWHSHWQNILVIFIAKGMYTKGKTVALFKAMLISHWEERLCLENSSLSENQNIFEYSTMCLIPQLQQSTAWAFALFQACGDHLYQRWASSQLQRG